MEAARQALQSAALYTDQQLYMLVHLPAAAITAGAGVIAELGETFSAVLVDKDEVTLVLPQDAWDNFAGRLPGHEVARDYRLITFDAPLDLGLVGFMALVSQLLAQAGVPLMAFSAFARDHLLIPAAHFEAAWQTLQRARESTPPQT